MTDPSEFTMSRISMIQPDQASGAAAEIFSKIKKAVGKVPNAYLTIGTHNPEALGLLLSADDIVSRGTLSKQDHEAINLAVSEAVGCDYCVAAHTAIGKMVGLSVEATRQIRSGQPSGMRSCILSGIWFSRMARLAPRNSQLFSMLAIHNRSWSTSAWPSPRSHLPMR